jgi:1,4-dihydroxy-2-naphthoate octaprenyltransferase
MDDDKAVNKRTTVVIFGRRVMSWCYLLWGIVAMAIMHPVWTELHLWALPITVLYLILHTSNWLYLRRSTGAALNPLLGKTAMTLLIFSLMFLIAATAS